MALCMLWTSLPSLSLFTFYAQKQAVSELSFVLNHWPDIKKKSDELLALRIEQTARLPAYHSKHRLNTQKRKKVREGPKASPRRFSYVFLFSYFPGLTRESCVFYIDCSSF